MDNHTGQLAANAFGQAGIKDKEGTSNKIRLKWKTDLDKSVLI